MSPFTMKLRMVSKMRIFLTALFFLGFIFFSLPFAGILGCEFEQSEYNHRYRLTTNTRFKGKGTLVNSDTIEFIFSPSLYAEEALSSYAVSSVLSGLYKGPLFTDVSFIVNGKGAGTLSPVWENSAWRNESDRTKGLLRLTTMRNRGLQTTIDGGIQTTGWRSLSINERRWGLTYGFGADYAAEKSMALNGLTAEINNGASYIEEDHLTFLNTNIGYTSTRKGGDSVVVNANLQMRNAEQPLSEPIEAYNHELTAKWGPFSSGRYSQRLYLSHTKMSFLYPRSQQNGRENALGGLKFAPSYSWSTIAVQSNIAYRLGNTSFANNISVSPRPNTEELAVANAKLGNEQYREALLQGIVALMFTKSSSLRLSSTKIIARMDYPFEYVRQDGSYERNYDNRDLLTDNDSLLLVLPIADTAKISLSRSTKTLHYLSSLRSSQNRVSTVYNFGINHLTSQQRLISTSTEMTFSVNEDSLYYPADDSRGRFIRRISINNMNDFNIMPGFRRKQDTAALEVGFARQDEGSLLANNVRTVARKTYSKEGLIALRFHKTVADNISLRSSVSYYRHKLTRVGATFDASDLSTNLDWAVGGTGQIGNFVFFLKTSGKKVDYNSKTVRDYVYINLNGEWMF